MLKKKVTKVTTSLKKLLAQGKKSLLCKECERHTVEVAPDIVAVTCGYCVQRQVAPPENIKPKPEGEKFPRGWALKARYIHIDGRVFEKGKETGEIVSLEQSEKKETVKKKVTKKKTPKRRK
jgi:hypothetical protein